MPPSDTDEWGLPDGADDEAAENDMGGDEVPSVHRQEKVPFGRAAPR